MDEDKVKELTAIVGLVSVALSALTKLGFEIAKIVQESKTISEEDKAALLAKIKEAQDSVPAWE